MTTAITRSCSRGIILNLIDYRVYKKLLSCKVEQALLHYTLGMTNTVETAHQSTIPTLEQPFYFHNYLRNFVILLANMAACENLAAPTTQPINPDYYDFVNRKGSIRLEKRKHIDPYAATVRKIAHLINSYLARPESAQQLTQRRICFTTAIVDTDDRCVSQLSVAKDAGDKIIGEINRIHPEFIQAVLILKDGKYLIQIEMFI